jgi:uncharacterized membrane protein YoaK (UPF0700 family)
VNAYLVDIGRTFSPRADARHGPLPPMLVAMTVVTGLVDAFSYLVLGHVFVANMTGNVVFMGFALAGEPGFSIAASALALVAFWAGAYAGGALGARVGGHRAKLLSIAASVEAGCIGASLVLVIVSAHPLGAGSRYALIALMAVALGLQNAAARRLSVPDLTTTVLTLTITGTAADSARSREEGTPRTSAGRRTVSVLSMFVGALAGALLIRHVSIDVPLALALCLLVGVGVSAASLGRADPAWATA